MFKSQRQEAVLGRMAESLPEPGRSGALADGQADGHWRVGRLGRLMGREASSEKPVEGGGGGVRGLESWCTRVDAHFSQPCPARERQEQLQHWSGAEVGGGRQHRSYDQDVGKDKGSMQRLSREPPEHREPYPGRPVCPLSQPCPHPGTWTFISNSCPSHS